MKSKLLLVVLLVSNEALRNLENPLEQKATASTNLHKSIKYNRAMHKTILQPIADGNV